MSTALEIEAAKRIELNPDTWATELNPDARYLITINDEDGVLTQEDVENFKCLLAEQGIGAVVLSTSDVKVYELFHA